MMSSSDMWSAVERHSCTLSVGRAERHQLAVLPFSRSPVLLCYSSIKSTLASHSSTAEAGLQACPLLLNIPFVLHLFGVTSLSLWRRQISWLSPQPLLTPSLHRHRHRPSPLHRLLQDSPSPQRVINEVLPKPPWRYTLCMATTTVLLGLTTVPCKT